MMKKLLGVFAVMTLLLATTNFTSAGDNHIRASLQPVDDSGVTGTVNLVALPQDRGTFISVVAFGLEDGEEYVSLYYENHTCELEPYSEEDEIGTYTGNGGGVGIAIGEADDPLDDVNSVSVRRASDFALLACADIHPE